MAYDLTPIHPELREIWKKFPRFTANSWTAQILQWLAKLQPKVKIPAGIHVDQIYVPSQDGKYNIRLKVYKSSQTTPQAPLLVWVHGGGFILGTPEQNDGYALEVVRELGLVFVSVDYRLAPQNPFPTPLEDCYTALKWADTNARQLGIDPRRIAIGGDSAGGGLAATLAQLAHDRGEVNPAFQLLVYPMLDDRTVLRSDLSHEELMTWNPKSNRFGWESYLHQTGGAEKVPPYSAASRREDLSGLPPAWIGVGTLDLFHDEDAAYAQKLKDCGGECEFVIVPGAFHGFDTLNDDVPVIRDFRKSQMMALKKYLFA